MTCSQAIDCFRRAVVSGRVASAYVVEGPSRGVAREFVERVTQALLCETCAPADAMLSGCGRCPACHAVARRTHPDVVWVEPQMKTRLISVAQIRDAQRVMNRTSFRGGWKVGVIGSADRLTDAASNAFLKTLEEPAGRTLFFLITDSSHRLLGTIRSRCQMLSLSAAAEGLSPGEAEPLIKIVSAGIGPFVVQKLAAAERVLTLLEQFRGVAEKEVLSAKADESVSGDRETLMARVNARYREYRTRLMQTLLQWHGDILLLVAGADASLARFSSFRDVLAAQARLLTLREAEQNVRVIEVMQRQLERNVPERPTVTAGFLQLR